MYQRRRNELKAIACELGAEPVGDRRKIQTWELAIERQAQVMDISIGVDRAQELIELAAQNSPGVDCVQELIELAVESSLGVDFAQELGVDRVQEPIELVAESSFGVDCVQEPIELVAESSPGVGTVETVSLESMCQWAPCDYLLLPLAIAPVVENFCPCGEVLASHCDGRTVVVRVYPDRTVRVPCYKNRVGCCSRSPPGGDVTV